MNVEMLDAGWLTAPAALWRQGEPMDEVTRFPIPAYVLDVGDERILVDTGLHPDAARDAEARYGPGPVAQWGLELEASVADQVDLRTVTKVVMTHLHVDHAGGLALVPRDVPVVVQRREWEAAHDREAVQRNFYLPVDYRGIEDQVVLVDGDHDLLGDGSVQLLLTPGHTPGHQSVRVGEDLVIGGDVTHYASGLDDHRFPMFADDFAAQAASAERLRTLRDAGATVLPGHDVTALTPGPVRAG